MNDSSVASAEESKPFLGAIDATIGWRHRLKSQHKSDYSPWVRELISTLGRFTPHFTIFVATSFLWGFILLHQQHIAQQKCHFSQYHDLDIPSNFTSNASLITCGHSTPEARAKGCRYDILSNHWVPAICMDEEAVAEYQSDGLWFGFGDENKTQRLTIAAMSELDYYYYTSERDHIVHCASLWCKQYTAFFEGRRYMDTLIASKAHTMHCAQFLVSMTEEGPDYWNVPIKTHVGYAGCWVRG